MFGKLSAKGTEAKQAVEVNYTNDVCMRYCRYLKH